MTATEAAPAETATEIKYPPAAMDLLLVRLLPATKQPPTPAAVVGFVRKYLPVSSDQRDQMVTDARAAGLVTPKGLRLTDDGRERAAKFLGTETPKSARSLDPLLAAAAGLKGVKPAGIPGRALISGLQLPIPAASNLKKTLVAVAAEQLGFPGETDAHALVQRLLSRAAGLPEKANDGVLAAELVRTKLGISARNNAGLKAKLVADWLTARPAEPEAFDLEAFANTVVTLAAASVSGRFGTNFVYISHAYRAYAAEPGVPRLELPAFKEKLVEANANGKLVLAKADLVQAFDTQDLKESKTDHLHVSFHFIDLSDRGPA